MTTPSREHSNIDFRSICDAIETAGLAPRGGFHPGPEDGVPPLGDGAAPGTVVLAGMTGERGWEAFLASAEFGSSPDPLDRFSRRVLGELAAALGAQALFPFGGPPFLPFLRWAQRAEPVQPSPMGPLIHPDHGLWHAYRGALAFAERIELPPRDERPRPCDTCVDRPCLATCPVHAFSDAGYDVPACIGFLAGAEGGRCLEGGCLARRACPVGKPYPPAQQQFHMVAFMHANRHRGD